MLKSILKKIYFFKSLRKAREQLKICKAMSDHEFASACKVTGENEPTAIAIRKVFADICNVPKENITPDVNFDNIFNAMKCGLLRGWDRTDFVLRLRRELKAKIILPFDVFDSFKEIDIDCIRFKDVLLLLLDKLEIKETDSGQTVG